MDQNVLLFSPNVFIIADGDKKKTIAVKTNKKTNNDLQNTAQKTNTERLRNAIP